MPGGELERPPTDDDRAGVIDSLRAAGGRLGLDELERRMDLALKAPSLGELALLVWDLPQLPDPPAAPVSHPSVWRNASFRIHATAYGLTNGMLVGIWGLTDSNHLFWPFFPIAGWGIGLGMHAVAAKTAQRHQQERDARRALGAANPRSLEAGSGRPAARDSNGIVGVTAGRDAVATGVRRSTRTSAVMMFTDMVDSTRLTAIIGDEDWTRVRARHRELLQGCYVTHHGIEVNSLGDGFLSRFETVTDAVQCAIEIQVRLRDERRQIGFSPSVRIGINAGDAIDEDGDLLGMAVNVAARVMSLADPGEILTTEAVADRLDDRFHLDDRGLRDLKGLDRSCHVLSVRWAG